MINNYHRSELYLENLRIKFDEGDNDNNGNATYNVKLILPSCPLLIDGHSSRCNGWHNDGDDSRSGVCSRGISCSEWDVHICSRRSFRIRCKRSTASRCASHSNSLCSLWQRLRLHFANKMLIKDKFLYSAVGKPQDCSKRFTRYSLADLFNRTPFSRKHPAIMHSIHEEYSYRNMQCCILQIYRYFMIRTLLPLLDIVKEWSWKWRERMRAEGSNWELRLEWRNALRRLGWGVSWNGPDIWKEWEMKNWQRKQMPWKWSGKGGEEDRECDGRTALREIWKEWEENGE